MFSEQVKLIQDQQSSQISTQFVDFLSFRDKRLQPMFSLLRQLRVLLDDPTVESSDQDDYLLVF